MIVISVVNRKGGVGKTTTVFNVSYALGKKNIRTLAVDFDPQASLTSILGLDPEELERAIDVPILSEVGVPQGEVSLRDVIVKTDMGFDLAPSRDQLELANILLTSKIGRKLVLKKKLSEVASDYDVGIIDCQTSISLLTINALAASDYVLIPVELAYLSIQGLNVLMNIILEVKQNVNPNLKILGILPTKYGDCQDVVFI
ncbi:ParA family protein [Archaeoglobus sp.]